MLLKDPYKYDFKLAYSLFKNSEHLKYMSYKEVMYKTKGVTGNKLEYYYNGCIKFTKDEIETISNIAIDIKDLYNILFIRVKSSVEFNHPFTLYNLRTGRGAIVLPPSFFKHSIDKMTDILKHELVHIDQKKNKDKYGKLYTSYGFIKNTNKSILYYINLKYTLITNPDGYDYDWLYPYNDRLYLPVLIDLYGKMTPVLFDIDRLSYISIAKINDNFLSKFSITRQSYHPNELFACNRELLNII